MAQDLPIGTRIRLISSDTRNALRNKVCTIVPPEDLEISWPSYSPRNNTIRMDDIGDGSLYFSLVSPDGGIEIVEGPEQPVRGMIVKRELGAHLGAIKRLIQAARKGNNLKKELRNADTAAGEITKMLLGQRGMCKNATP